MSASYQIHVDRGFVVIRYSGVVDVPSSVDNFHACVKDRDWSPDLPMLIDMSGAEGIDISFKQMLGMSHRMAISLGENRPIRIAYWAPHDLAYGVARMAASLFETVDFPESGVFRTEEDALRFLGLSESV